jgi:hypothetical protein
MRTNIARLISMLIPLLFCRLPLAAAERSPDAMEALLAAGVSGEVLDNVCGVRDCADIRLFWYTDMEAAKAAARATGKPILSLRLLGRLDEEFSCANSRFFRTVFYKNSEINELLRDQFVLHWRSVRPVPKVTIDFGDGSRLERTITGNSIHYVLDSQGRLVDALPGLYGPESFEKSLRDAAQAARTLAALNDELFEAGMWQRRTQQLYTRAEAFRRDLAALAPRRVSRRAEPSAPMPRVALAAMPQEAPLLDERRVVTQEELEKVPTARDPWEILKTTPGVLTDRINVGGLETGSKSAGEDPILRALREVSNDQIDRLAKLRRPRIHLDASSKTFLIRKHGLTDPKEAERVVDNFETTIALDEVINDYRTGPAILRMLQSGNVLSGEEVESFNAWVYEEVFKAPLSDPFFGLSPEDVYTALPATTRAAPR